MAAGFRSRNRHTGTLQVDGTYANYHLWRAGSIDTAQGSMLVTGTYAGPAFTHDAQIATLRFEANNPMLAFRSDSIVSLLGVELAPGTQRDWTATFYSPGWARIQYYIFSAGPLPGASPGPGMRVRNGKTGEVVFDSRTPPPRVLAKVGDRIWGYADGWHGGGGGYPDSFSVPHLYPGRDVAVAGVLTPASPANVSFYGQNDFKSRFDLGGWSCPSGSATFHWFECRHANGGRGNHPRRPSRYQGYGEMLEWGALIIDVSGL